MNLFRPRDYAHARTQLGWKQGERYILFSSSFANTVKNAPLAQAALAALHDDAVHLVELKDRSREEVALLLNACDAALMTSFTEGSPQFIKEAMACGAPVVATRVGDVEALIEGLQGHFLTKYDAQDIAHALEAAMQFRRMKGLTAGSSVLLAKGLDPAAVIGKILSVYRTAIAH
jgi:glycosyltransferase involved in cell wall biosynthesis